MVEVDGPATKTEDQREDARKEAAWQSRLLGPAPPLPSHYRAIGGPRDSSRCNATRNQGVTMKKIKILATSAALTLPVILPTVAQAKATWT